MSEKQWLLTNIDDFWDENSACWVEFALRAQLRKVVERLATTSNTVPSSYGGTISIHMSAPEWENLRKEAGL